MGSCQSFGDPRQQPACCAWLCCRQCSWQGRGCCPCCRQVEMCRCCGRSPTGDGGLAVSAEIDQRGVAGKCCAGCSKQAPPKRHNRPMKPPKPLVARLRILFCLVGSRGDVQPFVAFAMGLRRHGHTICIATHAKSFSWAAPMCKAEGIEFLNIGGNPEALMQFAVENPNLISFNLTQVRTQQAILYEIFCGCHGACERFKPDALVCNPPVQVHTMLAEKHLCPLQVHFTMPWTPTTAYPHPCAPAKGLVGNQESYHLVDEMQWVGLKSQINKFREKVLELPPIVVKGAGLQHKMEIPHLYCASPQLMPKPDDWGPHISVVGFWNLPQQGNDFGPSNRDWDPGLAAFLEDAPRDDLIYIGFGSIRCKDPRELGSAVMKAIDIVRQRRPKLRVLLSPGWAGIGETYEKITLSVDDADRLGLACSDTTVTSVVPGSIAAAAGIQGGKVDGMLCTRLLRIGIGSGALENVYTSQDVDAQWAKLRHKLAARRRSSGMSQKEKDPHFSTSDGGTLSQQEVTPAGTPRSRPSTPVDDFAEGGWTNKPAVAPVKVRLELATLTKRPGVYLVGRCPHDWLFPKCRAVVHHGGAGTTATGLIADCCTQVVPFFGDQPFWGNCCYAQGVGPKPIPVKEITAKQLASNIELMLGVPGDTTTPRAQSTKRMWQKVAELSRSLRDEDGVRLGVQAFHHMLQLDACGLWVELWQNQVCDGHGWVPSDAESGWPPWSDRTGWMPFHRAPHAPLDEPPSLEEMNLSSGWRMEEWSVWTQAEVQRETNARIHLDPEGWQYAFNWQKQATDPRWHGVRKAADAVRRRRWRVRKVRLPPLLFLRPERSRRRLLGYYRLDPELREWHLLPHPDRSLSTTFSDATSTNAPYGDEGGTGAVISRDHDGFWTVSGSDGVQLQAAERAVLPHLVRPGGWGPAGDESCATQVYEPQDFSPGETCEMAFKGSFGQTAASISPKPGEPPVWKRVTVSRRDEQFPSHYWVTLPEGEAVRVEAMKLRRPAFATREDDGEEAQHQVWLPSLDECCEALASEQDAQEHSDDEVANVFEAAEDGAGHLLDALVRTMTGDTVQRVFTGINSPLIRTVASPTSAGHSGAFPSWHAPSRQESVRQDSARKESARQESARKEPEGQHGGQEPVTQGRLQPSSPLSSTASRGSMPQRCVTDSSMRMCRDNLLHSGSFRWPRESSLGRSVTSPAKTSVRTGRPTSAMRARDASLLLLQTKLCGEVRCMRAAEDSVLHLNPDERSPELGRVARGAHILVQEVRPDGDRMWALVRLVDEALPKQKTDSEPPCTPDAGRDGWIDITPSLGTCVDDPDAFRSFEAVLTTDRRTASAAPMSPFLLRPPALSPWSPNTPSKAQFPGDGAAPQPAAL
eukprot:TRINITY_DN6450_c2_g1_i2.p1 TRINITY_DN6450_c2_g1~~TRINITY_DN6450_c2_g1_i2.p1  ORF type:complete len:1372 (+),score=269.11 TRINITY_DN6450_c2_g1_i2:82-4197(+)